MLSKMKEEKKTKDKEESNLTKWAGMKVFEESNYEEDKKIEELKVKDLQRR